MSKSYMGAGIALLYAILVVGLIAAKLAGHLHWSWWLVFSPLWLPVVLFVICAIVAVALFSDATSGGKNPFQ